MKRRPFVASLLVLAALVPAAAEKRKVTVDDRMRLRSLSEARIASTGSGSPTSKRNLEWFVRWLEP